MVCFLVVCIPYMQSCIWWVSQYNYARLNLRLDLRLLMVVHYNCALQVSCLEGDEKWRLSVSLYKLTASVSCSILKLSTLEPLHVYNSHWTTDL